MALNHERAEEEKCGLVRWLRPEFQSPQGAKTATQQELPGTDAPAKKGRKGEAKVRREKREKVAGVATGGRAEKRAWPRELPRQVAAVRDLLAEARAVDLASARAAFKGAKEESLAASLDSLAALGLAVATGAGAERSWSAVK